jgi:hypothetical protein
MLSAWASLALPVAFELLFYKQNGGSSIAVNREHPPITGMVSQCPKMGAPVV